MNEIQQSEKSSFKWREAFSIALPPFLLSRFWLALWVYIGHANWPYRKVIEGGYRGVDNWWLNPWTTYDSQHFLSIAQAGYTPRTTPFFPLYPLLLRFFGRNEISMAAGGVLLSNAAFFVGLILLYRLTRLDYDKKTSALAVWCLAFFPTSVIFSAVYTDAVYFACLVAAFWLARNGAWKICGLCAFLAALTRNAGAIIGVALFLEWWRQRKQGAIAKDFASNFFALGSALCPFLALIGVQFYLAHLFGGLPGVSGHQSYGRAWMGPWMPLWHETTNVFSGRGLDIVTLVNFAATLAGFALLWWQRKTISGSYAALLLGILLMQLTLGRTTAPFTNTSARLLSTTFPFLQLCALAALPLVQNRFRLILVGCFYFLIAALFAFLFGQKAFVCG